MRLARYAHPDGRIAVGVVLDDGIAELDGDDLVPLLDPTAAAAAMRRSTTRVRLDEVRLLAPVPRPPEFLAIGLNYADHAAEGGRDTPDFPIFFNKQTTCVVGPGEDIHAPKASTHVDYEGELGVVIGRRARHVPVEHALTVVGGYLVVNDVSVRDWQRRAPTMTLGKSWDTHGPTGPWIVTADDVADPQDLRLRTYVNDELLQDASTREMVFGIAQQISILSTVMTLLPGTLLATGTPAGVGALRQPPRFLQPGDTVRIEIDGIGVLENPVVAEPDDTPTW
ncbi:MAG: fumarylacetoacetate hydrolase family protein [Acidimicrobiales bacterium]|nr:fumarylacetoacetate hydrolase family protein [Acidimicrobiales bacterium]